MVPLWLLYIAPFVLSESLYSILNVIAVTDKILSFVLVIFDELVAAFT